MQNHQIPLKDATSTKHKLAETMPFNVKMFRGLLSKKDYLKYLQQQLAIFETIENIGIPHENLKRATNVQLDIDELIQEGISISELTKSTIEYMDHLKNKNSEEVLPHIYLNYLALAYGGQMIKKSVPSKGKMYDFENLQETVASIRAVQKDDWADEVNLGFDYLIRIFEELDHSEI
jgi:heme oxygenase